MNLQEANGTLRTCQLTEDELSSLQPLYIVLDLHKTTFCKFVDLVGKETLLKKKDYYLHLMEAHEEYIQKQKYLQSKKRLEELKQEQADLQRSIQQYESRNPYEE